MKFLKIFFKLRYLIFISLIPLTAIIKAQIFYKIKLNVKIQLMATIVDIIKTIKSKYLIS